MKTFQQFVEQAGRFIEHPSQEVLQKYAAFYANDNTYEGHAGHADPKEVVWELVDRYPITKLKHDLDSKAVEDLVADQKERTQEHGGESSFDDNWWEKPQHYTDCVIILERNGKGYIWDGWHRSAAAVNAGQTTIPAMVGHPK